MPSTITDTAYLTIISHLIKYPHAISGILLGTTNPPTITHALPLAHSSLVVHTSPLSQTALNLASQKASSQNLTLFGIYFGNDNARDSSISTVPTRLAEAVRQYYEDAHLLMIHPPALKPDARLKSHCFRICVRKAAPTWAKGVRPKEDIVASERALKMADMLMKGQLDAHVVADFEDHCLDPRRDWFNAGIEKSWADALPRS